MRCWHYLFALSLAALAGAGAVAESEPPDRETIRSMPFDGMLAGSDQRGFEKVLEVRRFKFPKDHGPHLGFQTEWWYFTGNLQTADQRRFGYQFTIFRRAMAPEKPDLDSDWASNQVYLAHIGITDVGGQQYLIGERYSRGALGLAGATALPFAVWVEDIEVRGTVGHCNGCLNLSMKGRAKEFSIDLTLNSIKPAVAQGDNGLSRKGEQRGNASYYYSLTRMKTFGTLKVRGQSFEVDGESWMDHEWFSSVLAQGDAGWDWFSLQLDDGREIMAFQIRRTDPESVPFKYGVMIDRQGGAVLLPAEGLHFEPRRTWKSGDSGSKYPVEWRIELPTHGMKLDVVALIDAQERNDSFRYWEGAIAVSGSEHGSAANGVGYLEMTGY